MSYFSKSSQLLLLDSQTSSSFHLQRLQVRYAALRDMKSESVMIRHDDGTLEEQESTFTKCDICLRETCSDNDELVFCDLCNSVVHQLCYRRELETKLPTGDWFCLRCTYLLHNNLRPNEVTCLYCSDLRGIMVPIKSPKGKNEEWVHNTCVNWIPEIWFKETPLQSAVSNFEGTDWTSGQSGQLEGDKLGEKYFKGECMFCEEKGGVTIRCEQANCKKKFHVRCGIRNGVLRTDDSMERVQKDEYNLKTYCLEHDKGLSESKQTQDPQQEEPMQVDQQEAPAEQVQPQPVQENAFAKIMKTKQKTISKPTKKKTARKSSKNAEKTKQANL